MKRLELYLHDRPIGTVKTDSVRGHETWLFTFDVSYLSAANPILDPDIANVRGPQFPRCATGFGFLLTDKGWRLAPMFDVNPNPVGGEHALDMGDLIKDADYYRMTLAEARQQYAQMSKCVKG